MKIPRLALCLILLPVLGRGESKTAPSSAPEAAQVAHALVFGDIWRDRDALAVSFDLNAGSVSDFAATFRERLTRDPDAQRRVGAKAYVDTFGRALPEQGVRQLSDSSYAELVAEHVDWLQQHPDEYRSLLNRAYLHVVRRQVYEEEIAYWQPHGVLPYFLLVAALEDWARRNQPGLMVTAGTPTISINSIYLETLRLTPGCAEQARSLIGIPTQTSSDASFASHRTIVAPSAGGILSNGGIHFLCVGAPDLVSGQMELVAK